MNDPAFANPPGARPGHGLEEEQYADAAPRRPVEAAQPVPVLDPVTARPVTPDQAPGAAPQRSAAPTGQPQAEAAAPYADQGQHHASAGGPVSPNARPIPRINIQAFCENQETARIFQDASQDRRLAKAHVTVQMGGVEAASVFYKNAPTPNLIIIESLHKREQLLADIGRLADVCDAGTKVVVVGHVNDVLLYRELLQRGVSEYLVMPFGIGQVMECLSNLYTDPGADPLGHVLAFIGAKGGVGSSTICHNVAWAISQAIQRDVVIADFDLPFGTAGLDFNQDPVQGIADALTSPDRVDEMLLDRLLSRCSEHLSLFASPATLDKTYDITANACDTVLDVLRKNIPYIAVDVPHLWTDWARLAVTQADQVVISAAPDLANLRNAKNLIEKLTAARPNDAKPVLVLNQVGMPKRPEIPVKDFESALDAQVKFVVDFDPALFGSAANNGQMIAEVSGKAKAAEQFRDLAMVLTDHSQTKKESSSLLAPLLAKLKLTKAGK